MHAPKSVPEIIYILSGYLSTLIIADWRYSPRRECRIIQRFPLCRSEPVMTTQSEKAKAFRDLHQRKGAFVIPNPWDAGTARLLAHLGFEALATTSAGFAFSQGRPDGGVTRADTMAHVRAIVGATELPVSADLEGGFATRPRTAP